MGRALDKTYSPTTDVIFDGGLSHDNDSQTKRFLQRWKWDFDYDIDFCEFTVDLESYSPLVSHRYTTPGTYVVGVKYIDDDGVEGDVYLFTVVVSSIKRYYYVKDHLGSIRQTIDDNGVVVEKQDYSFYGAILPLRSMNTASPNEKYKFTEKERDKESGLDYFGARYYDSEIGRWLSIDPLADKYPGWSPYNYCANNPLNVIDPDGMEWYYYQGAEDTEKEWHYHEDTPEMKIWTGEYDKKGNKIMKMEKGIIELLTFDGTQLNWLQADGNSESWAAVSGIVDENGHTQPELQFMKGGPIPEGWYKVDPSKTLSIYGARNIVDLIAWVLKYPSWGNYNTPIYTPEGSLKYKFNRNNAFIHGGTSYGSAGCIDLAMDNAAFFGAFQGHGKVLPLNVNYLKITSRISPSKR